MRLFAILLMSCLLALVAPPAWADFLQNTSWFGVDMRAGPSLDDPLIHVLDPGEIGERGGCDRDGRWCLLTARDKIGWVDTFGLAQPRSELARSDGVRPLRDVPIEMTPLDSPSRPLPGAILDAVNRASGGQTPPATIRVPPVGMAPVIVPGARAPRLLSTTEIFRNVTAGEINVRAGPSTQNAIVGRLRPGEGGLLEVCDPSERWCRIDAPGIGPAWVKMTLMGLRRP